MADVHRQWCWLAFSSLTTDIGGCIFLAAEKSASRSFLQVTIIFICGLMINILTATTATALDLLAQAPQLSPYVLWLQSKIHQITHDITIFIFHWAMAIFWNQTSPLIAKRDLGDIIRSLRMRISFSLIWWALSGVPEGFQYSRWPGKIVNGP